MRLAERIGGDLRLHTRFEPSRALRALGAGAVGVTVRPQQMR
jgi:hypothetical protein